jgi:hypothetical protein
VHPCKGNIAPGSANLRSKPKGSRHPVTGALLLAAAKWTAPPRRPPSTALDPARAARGASDLALLASGFECLGRVTGHHSEGTAPSRPATLDTGPLDRVWADLQELEAALQKAALAHDAEPGGSIGHSCEDDPGWWGCFDLDAV